MWQETKEKEEWGENKCLKTLLYKIFYTVLSKSIGTARSVLLFLLYTKDIWVGDQKMNRPEFQVLFSDIYT